MSRNRHFYITLKAISQYREFVSEVLHKIFKDTFTAELVVDDLFSSAVTTST